MSYNPIFIKDPLDLPTGLAGLLRMHRTEDKGESLPS